jgi:transketolase
VAETLVERCPVPMRRIGYRDVWPHSGSIEQVLDRHGLRPKDIAAAAHEVILDKRRRAGSGELAQAAARP